MTRQLTLPGLALAPYVRNFMMGRFANLENHLPASPSPQLVVYRKGGTSLLNDHGPQQALPQAFVAGPTFFPRTFRAQPGSEFVAVTFRPSGLTACLGVPANLFNGQLIPLEHFLPREEVTVLVEQLSLAQGARKITELMEAFLSRAMRKKPVKAMLPTLSMEQLLMPSALLAKSFDLSARQLERRFLVAYGMPLRDYRRLARFSAALAQMLSQPQSTGTLARIAVEANYVDQAHLIRDFRQFVGNTPGKVMKAQQEEESIYQFWRLSRTELHTYID